MELFSKEQPTVSYVITYTPHTPFDTVGNEVSAYLVKERYGEAKALSEEESVKLMASETDRMIGMLLDGLSENGLYDSTVIVVYADHYLYTMEDKSVLARHKAHAEDNRINHTPFFIWGTGSAPAEIPAVNSQLDILPTVLNLFGISYVPSNYIGADILDPSYRGIVFFPDASFYDGRVYVENGVIRDGGGVSEEELTELKKTVNDRIRKNDLTLRLDWFKNGK